MAKFKISRGSQSSYDSTRFYDVDTLYVCADTGNIYMGSEPLFSTNALVSASFNGTTKKIKFTTHGGGINVPTSDVYVDLSLFQTAAQVSAAINQAVSSLLKFKGSIAPQDVTIALLDTEKQGNVYNLSGDLEITAANVGLFTDGAVSVGDILTAGTNIVVVNEGTPSEPSMKLDVLSGLVDLSGYVEKVSDATAGNIAEFDSEGGVRDSGAKVSDFMPKLDAPYYGPTSNEFGNAGDQYVQQVTQSKNGSITVIRRKLPDFPGSGSVGSANSASDAWKTVVHDVSLSNARVLSGNTKIIPAATSSVDGYMTKEQAATLAGIAAGAQVNVLESVKVSGNALPITNKAVNIVTESTYNATSNKIATMADAGVDWGSFD